MTHKERKEILAQFMDINVFDQLYTIAQEEIHDFSAILRNLKKQNYGFQIRDKVGDLFVHLRSVQSQDRRRLKENTRVRFSVDNTEKGPQAENIRII